MGHRKAADDTRYHSHQKSRSRPSAVNLACAHPGNQELHDICPWQQYWHESDLGDGWPTWPVVPVPSYGRVCGCGCCCHTRLSNSSHNVQIWWSRGHVRTWILFLCWYAIVTCAVYGLWLSCWNTTLAFCITGIKYDCRSSSQYCYAFKTPWTWTWLVLPLCKKYFQQICRLHECSLAQNIHVNVYTPGIFHLHDEAKNVTCRWNPILHEAIHQWHHSLWCWLCQNDNSNRPSDLSTCLKKEVNHHLGWYSMQALSDRYCRGCHGGSKYCDSAWHVSK